MIGNILKFLLILLVAWIIMVVIAASKTLKKQQNEIMAAYQEKQETYRHIDSELFDKTPDQELQDAIMVHIFDKEDEDFEHLKEHLTPAELVVYTAYQMDICVDQGRGSVDRFFSGPSKEYLPHLIDAYQALGSEALVNVMQKAVDLAIQNQSGQYSEEMLGEDAPTFQSLTLDYLDLIESEGLNDKIVAYIRAHKKDFLN